MNATLPIGVFDSGVGGLTVLRALRQALPDESFLYLGDTARLPYGTKSPETIVRYARQAARVLVDRGIKLLVVACNTASAVALEDLRATFPQLGVVGVVEPGARAACAASRSGHIAVIGTESTVRGGAYTRAITGLRPDAVVVAQPSPLLVALAEEGWTEGPIATAIARAYLDPLLAGVDTLVLGCTHFPLLLVPIREAAGALVTVVDSAATTAATTAEMLAGCGMLHHTPPARPMRLMATDNRERFARVGSRFLGIELDPADVELIDL